MSKITDKDLLEDLIRVGKIINKIPTGVEYEKYGKYSVFPYKSRKKWNEWLMLAFGDIVQEKNKYKKRLPSFNELKNDLSKLNLNHKPTRREYEKYGKYSIESFYNYMSWKEWQNLCFPELKRSNSMRLDFTEKELVNELIRVASIVGSPPNMKEFRNHSNIQISKYLDKKSWAKWIEDIFNYKSCFCPNKIKDKELIQNLKELYEKLGRTPKKKDLRIAKGSKFGASAYQRAFGTISNALNVAGLKPHQRRGLDKKEIIDDIKRVYEILGHTPSCKEYVEFGKTFVGFAPIRQRFGSWTKALIEAGIPVVKARNVSKKDVIDALTKRYKEHNEDPSCLEYWSIRKSKNFPYSCNTIKNKFGYIEWEDIMKTIDPSYQTKDPFIGRHKHIGNDNTIYLSAIEKQAGDVLYDLKKSGIIQSYEYEVKVKEDKPWTCDFVINNKIWLEIDGMRNNRKEPYNKNNEKIQYYHKKGFNYKILSYKDDVEKFIRKIVGEKK